MRRLLIVTAGLATACSSSAPSLEFPVLARVDVGLNPHQIVFAGGQAFVAAAGSDRVTSLDAGSFQVTGSFPVPDSPLGLGILSGGDLAVSRFGANEVVRVNPVTGETTHRIETGGAPSLLVGPGPNGDYLVAVEQANRVWRLNASSFELQGYIETGNRPFPPTATSDGRLVFVPNYDDGTVTAYDAWNGRTAATTEVGEHPSGGAMLPDDIVYAVAVRGANRVALINTASFEVVDNIVDGIGDSPFSVVVAPSGRLAFVNNTASHDISVIDVGARKVVTRVPVGEQPIVMAVHPSGETLWVSSEGSHELTVFAIPADWQAPVPLPAASRPAEVAVLGMIHGRHPTSTLWGFDALEHTIRSFDPDIVCAEIPPNRWDRARTDYAERGVVEEPRVVRFPEYNDFMFRLAADMGFEIIPCAGWTREMSDLRDARIQQYSTDPAMTGLNAAYAAARTAARDRFPAPENPDDPRYIHSDAYDSGARAEYSVYDEFQNDWIGPGGWTNINNAHMKLVDRTIAQHPGARILVTFGAAHKYWFLAALANRGDVNLVDIGPHLPAR